MAQHANFERMQKSWDAMAAGDPGPAFDDLTDDVIVENGPGAGPWRHADGKEAFGEVMMSFFGAFGGNFGQQGRVLYADDAFAITLVQETGTHPDGDVFDNRAIYVVRFDTAGKIDRLWTVDLDTEHCDDFWQRHWPTADS
jgi:hypothetical protein